MKLLMARGRARRGIGDGGGLEHRDLLGGECPVPRGHLVNQPGISRSGADAEDPADGRYLGGNRPSRDDGHRVQNAVDPELRLHVAVADVPLHKGQVMPCAVIGNAVEWRDQNTVLESVWTWRSTLSSVPLRWVPRSHSGWVAETAVSLKTRRSVCGARPWTQSDNVKLGCWTTAGHRGCGCASASFRRAPNWNALPHRPERCWSPPCYTNSCRAAHHVHRPRPDHVIEWPIGDEMPL